MRRARRASLASQGKGAPVQCIGFWTSDISKNMHFRHMVHRCLFCLFSPKYQKYIIKKVTRPGPTRPDPTMTLFARQYLGKYWSYEKYLSVIKVRYMSLNCGIKIWKRYLWYIQSYDVFRKGNFLLILPGFSLITSDWNGIFSFGKRQQKDLNKINQN